MRWTVPQERLGAAWDRRYYFRKSNGWGTKEPNPFLMRGYTEMRMENVSDSLRKKILTILERGYSLTDAKKVTIPAAFIVQSSPHPPFRFGYIGKARMVLYMPEDRVVDLADALRGHAIMSEKIKSREIRIGDTRVSGFKKIEVKIYVPTGGRYDPDNGKQLVPHFTEMRPLIDEYMAEWLPMRQPVIDFVKNDDAVVQVPFIEEPVVE